MNNLGKNIWVFPDAFLPLEGKPYKTTSSGDQYSHESLCIVNSNDDNSDLNITFLFEDRDPIENFKCNIKAKRSLHLRLDNIIFDDGKKIPREKPYSIILQSSLKVVAQLSRLDTTSNYNAFMTSLGWGTSV
jgi:hypothetical protein